MINGIFIYGLRGEVLASRIYKDGLRRAVTDVFRVQVISNPECKVPILTLGSTSFSYIRHENLYIVAVTRHDVDAALVYELLYKFVEISTPLLGVLDENACTTKVHIVYEVLGELIDFGYPQHTDAGVLGQVLAISKSRQKSNPSQNITKLATGSTPWRTGTIKYRQNEIYLDIIESLNIVGGPDGSVVSSNIAGIVKMKTQLTGMPNCLMALNNTGDSEPLDSSGDARIAQLKEFQMHQCVNLPEFSRNQVISFVPPDGEFELMKYTVDTGINVPFTVTASVNEIGTTHVDYEVRLRAELTSRTSASDVVVKVPVPQSVLKTKFKASRGKVVHKPGQAFADWKISRLSNRQECKLAGTAELSPGHNHLWSRPPIIVEFNISMHCSSGLRVQYLKLDEGSGYQPLKWVRYLTKNGAYEIRI